MSLEDGLTALDEGEFELGGYKFRTSFAGDEGLDDVPEVESDDEEAAGDGDAVGEQRLVSRHITLKVAIEPGEGPVTPGDHEQFAQVLDQLRLVLSPLPDRSQTRLLRWRRPGEVAKRIAVLPGPGKPLKLDGDAARMLHAKGEATVRVFGPDPVVLSDDLHEYEFDAGETHNIVNAGTLCAVLPGAWELESDVPVTIENLDHDEFVRFPVGPVTVSRTREVIATGAYGIQYGPGSTEFPRWPLLRPGDNAIKASAPCRFTWRDSW